MLSDKVQDGGLPFAQSGGEQRVATVDGRRRAPRAQHQQNIYEDGDGSGRGEQGAPDNPEGRGY
jgi:hypothetical protein